MSQQNTYAQLDAKIVKRKNANGLGRGPNFDDVMIPSFALLLVHLSSVSSYDIDSSCPRNGGATQFPSFHTKERGERCSTHQSTVVATTIIRDHSRTQLRRQKQVLDTVGKAPDFSISYSSDVLFQCQPRFQVELPSTTYQSQPQVVWMSRFDSRRDISHLSPTIDQAERLVEADPNLTPRRSFPRKAYYC